MLFQSSEFLVLLLAVFAAVAVLRSAAGQQRALLFASYFFYGWWDVRFLILLLASTVVDYSLALTLGGEKLTWRTRFHLTLAMLGGCAGFLLLDWSALTAGDWDAVLRPGGISSTVMGVATVSIFAPYAYELYFRLPEAARRRALLVTSLAVNLGMLGYFKYHDFFADNLTGLASALGYQTAWQPLRVALPVGISFYTFQTLSYTIDVYRGQLKPERSFLRMALFVSYFPQLVAGPIIRPQTFLPCLDEPWKLREDRLISGFHLACVGLVKKIVIADSIAPLVDVILADPAGRPTLAVWLGTVLFAIQIYCDFSGYTDIARGVSRSMGVEIPINFNAPYAATSIADFWRRWHISLSSWLRDYLYIPLGGGRCSEARVSFNLMVTMLLGGLWHGASWNFVLWGGYQGVLLCINRQLTKWIKARPTLDGVMQSRPGIVFRWATTMYFVAFGWLIFRVTDFAKLVPAMKSFLIFDGRLGLSGMGLGTGAPFIALAAAGFFVLMHVLGRRGGGTWPERLDEMNPRWQPAFCTAYGFALFFTWPTQDLPFVYFQF